MNPGGMNLFYQPTFSSINHLTIQPFHQSTFAIVNDFYQSTIHCRGRILLFFSFSFSEGASLEKRTAFKKNVRLTPFKEEKG